MTTLLAMQARVARESTGLARLAVFEAMTVVEATRRKAAVVAVLDILLHIQQARNLPIALSLRPRPPISSNFDTAILDPAKGLAWGQHCISQ